MEVNTNLNLGGVGSPIPPKRSAPAARSSETASFTSSEAVEKALRALPSARAEAVERARTLTSDVNYPPLETIRKISKLLAMNIGEQE